MVGLEHPSLAVLISQTASAARPSDDCPRVPEIRGVSLQWWVGPCTPIRQVTTENRMESTPRLIGLKLDVVSHASWTPNAFQPRKSAGCLIVVE